MITGKIFNRIDSAAFAIAAILALPSLAGCSSDATSEPASTPTPAMCDEATVSISIAAPYSASTRADDGDFVNPTPAERKVSSIWVYFFKADRENADEDGIFYRAFEITAATANGDDMIIFPAELPCGDGNTADGEYTQVLKDVNIPSGDYRLYALANLDKEAYPQICPDNITDGISERDLRNTSIKIIKGEKIDINNPPSSGFTKATGFQTIQSFVYDGSEGLPMLADPHQHKVTRAGDDNIVVAVTNGSGSSVDDNGIVTIGSGKTTIGLTMTFLVAKVQLSIVFDNKPGGDAFPFTDFQLLYTSASNLNEDTKLGEYTTELQEMPAFVNIISALTAYRLPKDWNSSNPLTLSTDALENVRQAVFEPTVYQGTFYMPEARYTGYVDKDGLPIKSRVDIDAKLGNLATENDDDKLRLYSLYLPSADLENVDDKNTLTRGCFYDVVGSVTGTGIEMAVRVRKWRNGGRDAFEF